MAQRRLAHVPRPRGTGYIGAQCPPSAPKNSPRSSTGGAPSKQAITSLLDACGVDRGHKDFTSTASRVARVWSQEFLSGFDMDPAKILGDPVEARVNRRSSWCGGSPSTASARTTRSTPAPPPSPICPPPSSRASAASPISSPASPAVCTLQERACNDVVDALVEHLGARGAGCVMRGRHTCLSIPDNKHAAEVVTSSVRGEMSSRPDLQAQLFA